MATRCMFGILVFGSNFDLIYRFLTLDLFTYLRKRLIDRGFLFNEPLTEEQEVREVRFNWYLFRI